MQIQLSCLPFTTEYSGVKIPCFISATTEKSFSKPGKPNIVLVEGVRVPFTTVLTEYKDLLAYDLATGALRYFVVVNIL